MAFERSPHHTAFAEPSWPVPPPALHTAPPPLRATTPAHWRTVALWADDTTVAERWRFDLAQESLFVECMDTPAGRADAQVLHISSGLAAQLPRLREQRLAAPAVPLLVVCRSLRDLDQVLALEMGADDVIDAGVSAPVVAARLRALWRRQAPDGSGQAPPRELRFGVLHLLALERRVLLDERRVPLTEGEFEVLWLLASQAGQAVSRREILSRVRCLDDHPMDRSIDSRVYRIRAKLADHGGNGTGAHRIRTVRNHGYAFSPAAW